MLLHDYQYVFVFLFLTLVQWGYVWFTAKKKPKPTPSPTAIRPPSTIPIPKPGPTPEKAPPEPEPQKETSSYVWMYVALLLIGSLMIGAFFWYKRSSPEWFTATEQATEAYDTPLVWDISNQPVPRASNVQLLSSPSLQTVKGVPVLQRQVQKKSVPQGGYYATLVPEPEWQEVSATQTIVPESDLPVFVKSQKRIRGHPVVVSRVHAPETVQPVSTRPILRTQTRQTQPPPPTHAYYAFALPETGFETMQRPAVFQRSRQSSSKRKSVLREKERSRRAQEQLHRSVAQKWKRAEDKFNRSVARYQARLTSQQQPTPPSEWIREVESMHLAPVQESQPIPVVVDYDDYYPSTTPPWSWEEESSPLVSPAAPLPTTISSSPQKTFLENEIQRTQEALQVHREVPHYLSDPQGAQKYLDSLQEKLSQLQHAELQSQINPWYLR